MKQKVAVGLSGGVDSSVAVALLIEQGYDVTGVHLTCWSGPGCRSEEDRKDALDIAIQLNIPFVHLDFQKEYKEKVYEYMIAEYKAGRTPNPDVVCNKEIKFGLFYEWALRQAQGKSAFDFVATGHYAQIGKIRSTNIENQNKLQIQKNNGKNIFNLGISDFNIVSDFEFNNSNFLYRSIDEHKDQTYFLYQLRQEQLEHILFPIGHLTKKQVRDEAEKRGLFTAKKPDSVGICFIGEKPMGEFLKERIEEKEGEILMSSTHLSQTTSSTPASGVRLRASLSSDSLTVVVGKHKGVQFYTIGQRIGLVSSQKKFLSHLILAGFDPKNLPHFYVIDKDVEKNILFVGTDDALFRDEITLSNVHWIGNELQETSYKKQDVRVRIRHTGELIKVSSVEKDTSVKCKVLSVKSENPLTIHLTLSKSVRAVAPGQVAVLYQGVICLGGGVIC